MPALLGAKLYHGSGKHICPFATVGRHGHYQSVEVKTSIVRRIAVETECRGFHILEADLASRHGSAIIGEIPVHYHESAVAVSSHSLLIVGLYGPVAVVDTFGGIDCRRFAAGIRFMELLVGCSCSNRKSEGLPALPAVSHSSH